MKPLARRNKDGQIISFQLRVYVGRDENNRQSFETTTWIPDKKYTSEKKLLQAADRAQLNFEDQVKQNRKRLSEGKYSFQQFSELFMENHAKKHLTVNTRDEYSNMLKHLIPVFGEKEFTEISALEYEKFLGSLTEPGANKRDSTKGLSTKSVYNYRAFLSALYEKAILWKIAKENPIKSVERVKVKKKEIPVLTREETIKVFRLLDTDAPLRYNVFIRLALFTGMRRGEMCGLKWDCVDEKNSLITIKRALLATKSAGVILSNTKTEKSNRVIKIPRSLMELMLQLKKEQAEAKKALKSDWIQPADGADYVFTQINGMPVHPNAPYAWFSRFQERNNLKHCSLHALRHTNATLLIIYGNTDIKTISGRLGHSSTAMTTETYASFLQTADAMASDSLEKVFEGE